MAKTMPSGGIYASRDKSNRPAMIQWRTRTRSIILTSIFGPVADAALARDHDGSTANRVVRHYIPRSVVRTGHRAPMMAWKAEREWARYSATGAVAGCHDTRNGFFRARRGWNPARTLDPHPR
jgi:hypothetical protein